MPTTFVRALHMLSLESVAFEGGYYLHLKDENTEIQKSYEIYWVAQTCG